jgi:3-deoxy-7-phosphoheptulonate synthase
VAKNFHSSGNPDSHLVLRGGKTGPNYNATSVGLAAASLREKGLPVAIMIDASHANSDKDYRKQIDVVENIAGQVSRGSAAIMGVMIESNLLEGSQEFRPGERHDPRISITDACVNLDDSAQMLDLLAASVRDRRA